MKKIAVLCSGGDSPGMNACIRSVFRACTNNSIELYGIRNGFQGIIEDDIRLLNTNDIAHIIERGGTILGSSRSKDFMTEEGRKIAQTNLEKHQIEGLICIGGDGTFRGAQQFSSEHSTKVIGIPGTIDNDMFGTDFTIGYDTALNTIVTAVDKIRDTASSHQRLFIVEVMGRDVGFLALRSGIAVGAEAILIPETPNYLDGFLDRLSNRRKTKTSGIIICAEGDESGGALEVQKFVNKHFPHFETRVSILGHMQRGGSPSAFDRVLSSHLGYAAVEALINNKDRLMMGWVNGKLQETPLEKAVKHHQKINKELLSLAENLSV
jgi:6-phosphofructokinase 1